MTETENTLTSVENCLARLHAGDESAWDELFQHAYHRLLDLCGKIVGQKLSRPNPLITKNVVMAKTYLRLSNAMTKDNVNPTTAREFFGLAARHIRWQIHEMLRKRAEKQGDADIFTLLSGGTTPLKRAQDNEKWDLFWSAADELTDDEREVFDLRWMNGLSQYEIADTIGKTRNQVDTIWRRIKIKIAKKCKDYDTMT